MKKTQNILKPTQSFIDPKTGKLFHLTKARCFSCNKDFKTESLYRFTWRYNDKKNKYTTSKRYVIHTGYTYLCKKCLLKLIKEQLN